MTSSRRFAGLALAFVIVCSLAGCGEGPNDGGVSQTKGTAAADAPKSQADFFKQQQAKLPTPKSKTKRGKNGRESQGARSGPSKSVVASASGR
ncbi:hypothetical protein ACYOEI_13070 [Singulisphaera rosea]